MRIHVTNWTIPNMEDGATSFNANPPGEPKAFFIEGEVNGQNWLRIVSIELPQVEEKNDPRSNSLMCRKVINSISGQECGRSPATMYENVGWCCDQHAILECEHQVSTHEICAEDTVGYYGRVWLCREHKPAGEASKEAQEAPKAPAAAPEPMPGALAEGTTIGQFLQAQGLLLDIPVIHDHLLRVLGLSRLSIKETNKIINRFMHVPIGGVPTLDSSRVVAEDVQNREATERCILHGCDARRVRVNEPEFEWLVSAGTPDHQHQAPFHLPDHSDCKDLVGDLIQEIEDQRRFGQDHQPNYTLIERAKGAL